jgi:ABC-type antimicrobial peptide transport system ATPase subunit
MVNGEAASPLARPGGCLFHPRCPSAQAVCVAQKPALREVAPGWEAACHFPHAAAAAGARSGKVEPGFPLERAAD